MHGENTPEQSCKILSSRTARQGILLHSVYCLGRHHRADLSRGENGVPARMAFEGIKNDEFVFDILRAYETSGGQVQPQHHGLFQSAHGLQQANFRLQYP